jgi:hypothetical protein
MAGAMTKIGRKSIIGVTVATTLAAGFTIFISNRTSNAIARPSKAVIEIGFDAPTPDFLRANIKTMEKRPFGGMMINLHAGKTVFNKTAYPDAMFADDRRDLAAVKSKVLTENFITMWSAREANWDWFNDGDWEAAQTNMRNFAKTAAAGSTVRGFAFDPEPYGTDPWAYNATLYPTRTFDEVTAKVRSRGASFMSTVQAEMPSIKILTLFGLSAMKADFDQQGGLDKIPWALYRAFLDGMLDVIGPKVQLIDGNETSYYYTASQDFDKAKQLQRDARAVVSESNRAKYDKQVTLANAVFADGLMNFLESPRFFGFFIETPLQRQQVLEHHLLYGLRASNQYVWLYNEAPDFWGTRGKGPQIPDGLDAIPRRVAEKVSTGKPLGIDMTFLPAAAKRLSERVELAGQILEGDHGLASAAMDAGFNKTGTDYACTVNASDGYFSCYVPKGWSGTLTPLRDGYQFDPPTIKITNAEERRTDLTISARR